MLIDNIVFHITIQTRNQWTNPVDTVDVYNSVSEKRRGRIDSMKGSYEGYKRLPIITSNTHQMIVKFSSQDCDYVCYSTNGYKGFEAMFSAVEVDQK